MPHIAILALIKAEVAEGQKELAQVVRLILNRTAPHLFQLLDPLDDSPFLEPLLFAYFNTNNAKVTLDQLLLGYIQRDSRPAKIPAFVDETGVLFLPRIGYFSTGEHSEHLQLYWPKEKERPILMHGESLIPYDFEGCTYVNDSPIEVLRHNNPLLRAYFDECEDTEAAVTATTTNHRDNLECAAALIRNHYPQYFDLLASVTRGVLLYRGVRPYSFATLSAHGLAFLNATNAIDEIFFIEDLIHQAGHIVFNATTNNKAEYLNVNPDAPLSDFAPVDDTSSVYASFHGLFTQTNITYFLYVCYVRHLFTGRKAHELLGRFSDDMKRFASALCLLDRRELYTEKGWTLYSAFKDAFVQLYHKSRPVVDSVDTSNQPYIFDYNIFQQTNPLHVRRRGHYNP